MPWCPVCKYEYKDGIKLCADCGAELVDVLEDNNPEPSEEVIAVVADETEDEFSENDENELSPEEVMEMVKSRPRPTKIDTFVKASDRAENYRSSAFALLIVGGFGIVFLILAYLGIIKIALAANINILFYAVMGFMFIVFIVVGIKSLSAAKVIQSTSKDEEDLTNKIYEYMRTEFTKDSIDEMAIKDEIVLSEEEKFFPRSIVMRNLINEKFGELDDAFMTELVENAYSEMFDK